MRSISRTVLFYLLAALMLPAASCRKNECRDNTPFIHFSGFDSTGLSGMIKKRYRRTPDFASFIANDSFYLTPATSYSSSGTVRFWEFTNDAKWLDPAYNYIIEMPNSGKTFRIRDIYFDARTEKDNGLLSELDRCCNTVHFTLNDSFYTIHPLPESERFQIVLEK